jgi:hypothetical protein
LSLDPSRELQGPYGIGERTQDQEFVTAGAIDGVGCPSGRTQGADEFSQSVVARFVALSVVDGLEAVEVEHQNGKIHARSPRRLD